MDTAIDPTPPGKPVAIGRPGRRRHPRLAVALVLALVLVPMAVGVIVHRLAFPDSMQVLTYYWDPAEGAVQKNAAGDETEQAVASRPHVRQTFYVQVINHTSVTQTIVGLQRQDGPTLENPDLGVSGRSANLVGDPLGETYGARAAIPGGTSRWLRYRFSSPDCDRDGGRHSVLGLDLRIRAGGITRDRALYFDHHAMTTVGTAKNCPESS